MIAIKMNLDETEGVVSLLEYRSFNHRRRMSTRKRLLLNNSGLYCKSMNTTLCEILLMIVDLKVDLAAILILADEFISLHF